MRHQNEQYSQNEYIQYRWWDYSMKDDKITSTIYELVEDIVRAMIQRIYSNLTLNQAQAQHRAAME